jgi:hypothetical protein
VREEGRRALEALLAEPLVCHPVETDEGKRYQISGKIAVGSLFTIDGDPNGSLGMVNASRFNELAAFTLQVKLVA